MTPVTNSLLSIVVPLFNEQDNVVLLTEKIHESLVGYTYQIIYVDDFSTDKTRKIVKNMQDDTVHLIELKKNYGQSLALAAGIDYAEGEFIITMDGDLQNDPSDIPQMLGYAVEGEHDLITGIRQKRKDSLVKKILSKIGCVTVMFISSPVSTRKSKLLFRSITMSAPVLVLPILVQALTITSASDVF